MFTTKNKEQKNNSQSRDDVVRGPLINRRDLRFELRSYSRSLATSSCSQA